MNSAQILGDANTLERALAATRYYPLRHMAPLPMQGKNSWQNDGQNLVFDPYEGLWRTWALGNPDWAPSQGFPQTSWIEYAGPALDQMVPIGMRIDRSTSPANTYWSGSCFVDWHNRLGRGYGAAWYYISGPAENGLQAVSLLTAPKLGVTPYPQGIVIPNEAVPEDKRNAGRDFRDCRVIWDDEHDQLVLSATCGSSFIFFASQDGLSWQYLSTLTGPGPLVECPNMLQVPVRDENGLQTGEKRWVILGAVQGPFSAGTDSSECCTLWVGSWNGKSFIPDAGYPLPLDYGPDSYATTAGTDHLGTPYLGYWLGNWNYCASYMPFAGFQNIQGLPRRCWLQPDPSGTLRLFSAPLATDMDAYSRTYEGPWQTLDANVFYSWPDDAIPTGKCARIDITLEKKGAAWPDVTTLQLRAGAVDGVFYHTDIIIHGDSGTVTFDRASSGLDGPNKPAPGASIPLPDAWTKPYTIPASVGITASNRITLSVLLDSCSVEAFFNGGLASMAGLIFPPDTCQGLTLLANGPVSATATIHHY